MVCLLYEDPWYVTEYTNDQNRSPLNETKTLHKSGHFNKQRITIPGTEYELYASTLERRSLWMEERTVMAAGVATVHAPPATTFPHFLHSQIPTHDLFTVFLPQKAQA